MTEISAAASGSQDEILPTSQRPRLGPDHVRLGRALTILLAGCAGFSTVSVLLDVYGLDLFSKWQADPSTIVVADAEKFDAMSMVIFGLNSLVVIATGIITMSWLYQAYGSREADPALLPHKRWWTIGGWLIPFISLVRPFQLMRNLYLATNPPSSQLPVPDTKIPACFGWWWVCYLLGSGLTNIAERLVTDDADLGLIQVSVGLDLVSQLILIAAALLFMGVLRSITINLSCQASA
jgi:Domain of unknown function (DUF4328)